jgi:2'-5' RNA ligase/ribosomal protein S18 acetylase RimI-like enzyme
MRLGVALLIPEPLATEINGLRRALGDGALRRIPPHLTLVPPVNVREDRLHDALAVLRAAAAETPTLTLELGPPATFLPVTPVLYLSLASPVDEVRRLRNRVFVEPLARQLTHGFVPHVTLVDEAEPDRIADAQRALAAFEVEATVDRVHLLQEGEGRVWTPIAEARFAPRWVAGRGGIETELTVTTELDPEASAFAASAWSTYSFETYGSDPGRSPVAVTARRAGHAVGVATGEVTGRSAYLARLIVSPDVRSEGVGAHLLVAFEEACRQQGAERMTLRTIDGGSAEAFYRSRGYATLCPLPAWRQGRDFVQLVRPL